MRRPYGPSIDERTRWVFVCKKPELFGSHGAVHNARPDVHCVLHTHTRAGIAVAAQEEGLLPISQHASVLVGRIAYHEFEGIATRPDEQERLVANLGDRPVMILRNHGLLVAGGTAADAFRLINILERACEIQVAALADGAPVRRITQESIDNSQAALASVPAGPGRDWTAMMRLVARVAPDFDS